MKLLSVTTAALSLALLAPLSLAHEFWIKPSKFQIDPGSKLDVQLFVGDGFPGEVVARNGPKIETFAAFSDAGELPIPGVNGKDPAGSITFDKPGTQVIAFRNLPSRIELEASKFEAYLKEEGLDSIIAKRAELGHSDKPGRELYSRCAKSIVRVGDASQNSAGFDREVGLRFELIPITNPANIDVTKDSGQVFTVKAIYEGKPLASAKIAARTPDDPKLVIKATTDADGRASLPLTKSGMWLVSAVHMVAAPENSNADWESLWASVTFQAPEASPPAAPATDAGAAASPKPKLAPDSPDDLDAPVMCGEQPLMSSTAPMRSTLARVLRLLNTATRSVDESLAFLLVPSSGETKYRLANAPDARVLAPQSRVALNR